MRFALPALAVLLCLSACRPPAAPPVLAPEPGARWVVGGAVREAWVGLPWGGSLVRLASNPDAVEPACGTTRRDAAPGPPVVLDARDVVWPGARAALPAWVVVRPTGHIEPDGRCVPSEAGPWIGRGIRGAAMLVEGPRAELPLTPEDAERSRLHEIRALAGWELLSDGWHPGAAVVAVEQTEAPTRALACAPPAHTTLEELTALWVRTRLASPTVAAEADATLTARVASLQPAARNAWAGATSTDASGDVCSGPEFALLTALGGNEAHDAGTLLAAFPDSPDVAIGVATLAWSAGHVLACGEALDLAQSRRPDAAPAALLRGRLMRDVSGRHGEALRSFERAAASAPWQAVAAYEIGLTHEALGDDERAVASYLVAWEADRRFADPSNALGWQAWQRGDVDAAREFFVDATERDPNHATALANLAVIAEREDGQPERAAALYREALERDPAHADAHFGLGMLQMNVLGDLDAAEFHLLEAIDAAPTDREAREALQRLRGRPSYGVDRLVGLWQAEWVDEAGDAHRSIATVQPDQVWVTVDEVAGEPQRTEWRWELVAVSGPQLRIRLTRPGAERELVVEWVDDDTTDWFAPDDPANTRVRWSRWASTDASTRAPQPPAPAWLALQSTRTTSNAR